MKEFDTQVGGIPCRVRVTSWERHRPGQLYGRPEHCYPDEGGFGTWELLDRKGYRAAWLDEKLSPDDVQRLEQEVFNHMETQHEYV